MGDRETTYLQNKLASIIGDVRQPKYETRRAALDIAIQRVGAKVMHHGSPTGHETERGAPEVYPGAMMFGSNQHLNALVEKVKELDKDSYPALKQIATSRGYYGSHPPSTQRFEYVENYDPQTMESFDANGERVTAPVYGRGTALQSKFADYESVDREEIVYGNPETIRGSDRRSRFANVRQAPTLPNGSIDYDAINKMNGHTTPTGRRNITTKVG
jgi:hypothetical protein